MSMTDKLIVDGKVAILYSPGFGAGWSTWAHADDGFNEFLVFDKGLVELAQRRADVLEVEAYINSKFGDEAYVYMGGWEDIEIEWLPVGHPFEITEYDGAEKVKSQIKPQYIA